MLTHSFKDNTYSSKLPTINNHRSQNLPKLAMLQKSFGSFKPVNGFKRFGKEMRADTGEDPNKAYIQFINKDLIQPLKRPTITEPQYSPDDPLKWTVGCTKKCNSPRLLPKKQQFIDRHYSTEPNQDYSKCFLPTDHISVRVPTEISKSNDQQPFLNMKAMYGPHSESKQGWVPREYGRTVANRNSVPYNIINYTENNMSGAKNSDMLDRTLNNKKKGVAEFSDFTRPSFPNFRNEYRQMITENKKIFHNYNGIFSDLYDSAKKNGNICIPFRRNEIELKGSGKRRYDHS